MFPWIYIVMRWAMIPRGEISGEADGEADGEAKTESQKLIVRMQGWGDGLLVQRSGPGFERNSLSLG